MQLYVLTLCIQAPRYPVACSDAASSRDRTVWIAGVTLTHAVAGRQVVSAGRTVTGPGTTGRTATDRVPSAPQHRNECSPSLRVPDPAAGSRQ